MAYLVTCTFDLADATRDDYKKAYAALEQLGLERVLIADNGNEVVAPTTMTVGEFEGQTASRIRDFISEKVKGSFAALGLRSEIFHHRGWRLGVGLTQDVAHASPATGEQNWAQQRSHTSSNPPESIDVLPEP